MALEKELHDKCGKLSSVNFNINIQNNRTTINMSGQASMENCNNIYMNEEDEVLKAYASDSEEFEEESVGSENEIEAHGEALPTEASGNVVQNVSC